MAADHSPEGFTYQERKSGEVVVHHHGREAALLRGKAAAQFLARVGAGEDAQQLMARATGNYKRGNERHGASKWKA